MAEPPTYAHLQKWHFQHALRSSAEGTGSLDEA
jgi:hypothetical protein